MERCLLAWYYSLTCRSLERSWADKVNTYEKSNNITKYDGLAGFDDLKHQLTPVVRHYLAEVGGLMERPRSRILRVYGAGTKRWRVNETVTGSQVHWENKPITTACTSIHLSVCWIIPVVRVQAPGNTWMNH